MKKIIIIILIYIIISVIVWLKYIEYENYINEPYITVYGNSGLNNKIQVLLSYLYKANKEGKKLKFFWIKCIECYENFDNLFYPIENVTIISEIENNEYDYKTHAIENTNYINENYYSLLKPINSIQSDIDNTKKLLEKDYIACHLRRTDGWNHYRKDNYDDDEYMDFIDQYPKDLKIYIATDCRNTQQKFIDKYGDRLIYKKIEDNKLQNTYRQTSIQDAVKDMYVCAGAKYFMKSGGTFSDTIMHLRNLNIESFKNLNPSYNNTIVAGYYNVKSKRPSNKYYNYAKNFLKLKQPIVLYTSQDNYDKFMKMRGNLPIKIVIQEFDNMYMWKKYKNKWIDHYKIDPEAFRHSPELYAIWANKVIWLEDAIKKNYFNTKYFQYTDFGSVRIKPSYNLINNYPIINHYKHDKLLISLINEFTDDDYIIKDTIIGEFLNKDRVACGFFGGNINACIKFRIEYEIMLNNYFNNNIFAGKDQSIVNSLILAKPELFTIIKVNHWFYMQDLLSNKLDIESLENTTNVFYPKSLIIPNSINISRNIKNKKRHTDNQDLDNYDLAQYDYKTLFFDCWIYNNKLTCVGPDLMNLYNELLPLKIVINNIEYKYELSRNHSTFLYVNNIVSNTNYDVNIYSEKNSNIQFNIILQEQNPINAEHILVTLQKNNNLIWIKDWVNYYLKNFVDAVLIFDNNSDNFNELVDAFKNNKNVYICQWNFTYGTYRQHANNYCQEGSLNVANLKYCNKSYLYNFDIDEVLVSNKNFIINKLKTYDVLSYDNYIVRMINEELTDNYSFNLFKYKNKKLRGKAHKYIVNCKKTTYIHGHNTNNKNTLYVNPNDGFFLHYAGINNNWKTYGKRSNMDADQEYDLISDNKYIKNNNIILL